MQEESKKEKKKNPIKLFFTVLIQHLSNSDFLNSAVIVAYFLMFALFPMIIMIGNLLPYLQITPESVLPYIHEMFPDEVYGILSDTITSLLVNSNGSLLSISAIGTWWAVSRSINALQNAMNKAYGVSNRQNLVLATLVSTGIIILLFLALYVFLTVFAFGQITLDYLTPIFHIPKSFNAYFTQFKWPVTVIGLFVTMSFIYFLAPNAKVHIRTIFPGALFTTLGWMGLTELFGYYVKYFTKNISSYGIIGTVTVLMIWLNVASTIIIIGGVITSTFEEVLFGEIIERHSLLFHVKKIIKNRKLAK